MVIAGTAARASNSVAAATAFSDATDFSSLRGRRRGGSAAAGLAFVGLAIGAIGAMAA